jgi:hypothetical protein
LVFRTVALAAILVAAVAPPAHARTKRVRWEQTAILADRVDDQIGFVPIKGIQPDFSKRPTVRSGGTTYKVLWTNNLFNRRSTSIALREIYRNATQVPTSYYGVYTDRFITKKEKRRFTMKVDLARDADVLVVNRANPVCASGLTRHQVEGIARGSITRWSQVTTLAAGQPDAIVRRAGGFDNYALPRFGIQPVPGKNIVSPDGGVVDAYASRAVAGITSWSHVRGYPSVCAVPIDGVRPTDVSVFNLHYGPAYPITYVMTRKHRRDAQGRAMVAAYVDFLRSEAAAALFRKNGLLMTADGPPQPPAAAARYRNWHCVFQSGPEYTFTVGTTGKRWKSTTYFLEGFGSNCRFAKKWVRRLAKEPYSAGKKPRPRTPAMHHGPRGWRCQGSFISPAEHPLTQFDGVCQNRRNKARVFSWEPQSGYNDGPVDPGPLPDPVPEPLPDPTPEPPPEI